MSTLSEKMGSTGGVAATSEAQPTNIPRYNLFLWWRVHIQINELRRVWDLFSPDTGNNIKTFRLNAVHTVEQELFSNHKRKVSAFSCKGLENYAGAYKVSYSPPLALGGGGYQGFQNVEKKIERRRRGSIPPLLHSSLIPPCSASLILISCNFFLNWKTQCTELKYTKKHLAVQQLRHLSVCCTWYNLIKMCCRWVIALAVGVPVTAAIAYVLFGPGDDKPKKKKKAAPPAPVEPPVVQQTANSASKEQL